MYVCMYVCMYVLDRAFPALFVQCDDCIYMYDICIYVRVCMHIDMYICTCMCNRTYVHIYIVIILELVACARATW